MLAKFTTDELVLIPGWGPRVIVIGPLILSYGSPWALILPIISGFLAGVNPEGGGCLPGLWKSCSCWVRMYTCGRAYTLAVARWARC